ncbi:MAG: hypothetical protein PVF36_02210 [Desulfobacterales bacterium]|jgi:hypothetical protein
MLFTLWASLSATTQQVGKAGGLQIRRCQGFAVVYYGFTLGALALKPSDFCNVRVFIRYFHREIQSIVHRTLGQDVFLLELRIKRIIHGAVKF